MRAIYLSGQFEDAPVLRQAREQLVAAGYRVTSRWLDAPSSTPATALADQEGAGERLAAIARQDFEDIDAADAVVVFNPAESCSIGRGGRHVETGYALALGKPVAIVGARGNIFHWLPEIAVVPDWPSLADWLQA
ncbi:MAG TPA: nucleoside 2-deoxyribosyltransferase [Vicinamibacterales bacterium]|nr:nucleoside 2-deoxyribosyltransferase [Vicinamibacterales bacterium]